MYPIPVLLRRNVEDWNEDDEQSRLLNLLPDAWLKRAVKGEAKRAKSNHTVKMMHDKEHHKKVVNWRRAKVAREFKRQSLRNALLITISGICEKAAIWRLEGIEVGGQTICLQAIQARMSCDDLLEWVGEEVLKEYKILAHDRGLQVGDRSIRQVGAGSDGKALSDPAGAKGGKCLNNDDNEDEPAQTAACAFVASNLHKGSKWGSWKPLQQGWKKRKKKEPCRLGDPPLSFREFIRAHPEDCLVCYGRSSFFQHDHRACPIHKADTEAYKKAHRTKKRTSDNIREAKVEVSKDERAKFMMVGTEPAKDIQEIKTAWGPKPDKDKDKDREKKGKGRGRKKGVAVNEVAAKEDTPTTDARWRSPCTKGPQARQSADGAPVNAAPSTPGIVDSPGRIPSGMPGAGPEVKNSRNC